MNCYISKLDAIHISTALIWKDFEEMEDLVLISHDKQMNICARAVGLTVIKKINEQIA